MELEGEGLSSVGLPCLVYTTLTHFTPIYEMCTSGAPLEHLWSTMPNPPPPALSPGDPDHPPPGAEAGRSPGDGGLARPEVLDAAAAGLGVSRGL